MSNLIDDIGLWTKRIAAFVSGKGATMTAVALASPFIQGFALPIVGIIAGLPINAALSTMKHQHDENKILVNFRHEIAASFGIDPSDVTHDHLRTLAFGDEEHGIRSNPVLKEALERNDSNRWMKIGTHGLAAALATGFTLTRGEWLIEALKPMLASSAVPFLAASPAAFASVGLALTVGALMLATSHLFESIGQDLFSNKESTSYEKIEGLAKQRGKGVAISKQQVMALIIDANPELQDMIANTYHGSHFMTLPKDLREQIVDHYDAHFNITDSVNKINSGQMKINELVFIAVGEHSGVPEREASGLPNASQPQNIRERISHVRGQATNCADEIKGHIKQQREDSNLIDAVLQGQYDGDEHESLNNPDMPAGAVELTEDTDRPTSKVYETEHRKPIETPYLGTPTIH